MLTHWAKELSASKGCQFEGSCSESRDLCAFRGFWLFASALSPVLSLELIRVGQLLLSHLSHLSNTNTLALAPKLSHLLRGHIGHDQVTAANLHVRVPHRDSSLAAYASHLRADSGVSRSFQNLPRKRQKSREPSA